VCVRETELRQRYRVNNREKERENAIVKNDRGDACCWGCSRLTGCMRSGWGMKRNQEVTLGIWLKRPFFEEILATAALTTSYGVCSEEQRKAQMQTSAVRLQWDPDRMPDGSRLERRAVQLGMKNDVSRCYASSDKGVSPIVGIVDLRQFVEEQRICTEVVPCETVMPLPASIAAHIAVQVPK